MKEKKKKEMMMMVMMMMMMMTIMITMMTIQQPSHPPLHPLSLSLRSDATACRDVVETVTCPVTYP